MTPLPFPVRIAAGLVAIAVEQARDLPRLIIEFPVTAVSQALQAPWRVQQKVNELAHKGDHLLGTLCPVEEQPSAATFSEDEPPVAQWGEQQDRESSLSAVRLHCPRRAPRGLTGGRRGPRRPAARPP